MCQQVSLRPGKFIPALIWSKVLSKVYRYMGFCFLCNLSVFSENRRGLGEVRESGVMCVCLLCFRVVLCCFGYF